MKRGIEFRGAFVGLFGLIAVLSCSSVQAQPMVFNEKEHWLEWTFPKGLIEISEDGEIRPHFVRKDVNACLNADRFTYGEEEIRGGVHEVGSNPDEGPNIIDGDPTTSWAPNPNDPMEDRWIEVDLGRLVSATRIRLMFSEEGPPFERFRLRTSTGEFLRSGAGRLYEGVAETVEPNDRFILTYDLPPLHAAQYVRFVATTPSEGARLVEMEVWAVGDNVALGWSDRGGSVEDESGGSYRAFDGLFTTWWDAYVWSPFKPRGLMTVDLGGTFWVDTVRLISGEAGYFSGYVLGGSDGSRWPDGTLKWEMLSSREREWNSTWARRFEERLSPRKIRYVTFVHVDVTGMRSGGYGAEGSLSELQLFGEGYVPDVTMTSPFMEWSDVEPTRSLIWEGDVPPGTRVEIRTRSGDTLDPVHHYFNKGGEEISEEAWQKLPAFFRGEITTTYVPGADWSAWSDVYGQGGDAFRSPMPRRMIQVQARLLSDDPFQAASLRCIELSSALPMVRVSEGQSDQEKVPAYAALFQNVPNPFNSLTTIRYEVPVDARIVLCIYNLSGQKIRTLISDPHKAGRYTVTWDGTDQESQAVGSGVYLYRLAAEGFQSTKRMVLIR